MDDLEVNKIYIRLVLFTHVIYNSLCEHTC
jgi:hypothetical protein